MKPKIHDPYGPMEFDNGVMLTVIRSGSGTDKFGDPIPGQDTEHEIGPCAVHQTESEFHRTGSGPRDRTRWSITAPNTTDIRESDQVRLPDGTVGVLTAAPVWPKNPFTGWQPFCKFTVQAS